MRAAGALGRKRDGGASQGDSAAERFAMTHLDVAGTVRAGPVYRAAGASGQCKGVWIFQWFGEVARLYPRGSRVRSPGALLQSPQGFQDQRTHRCWSPEDVWIKAPSERTREPRDRDGDAKFQRQTPSGLATPPEP